MVKYTSHEMPPSAGDYGDMDLYLAILHASAHSRSPALVTFGHMHSTLYKRRDDLRNMAHVDAASGKAPHLGSQSVAM
jgi:hypothetical protein